MQRRIETSVRYEKGRNETDEADSDRRISWRNESGFGDNERDEVECIGRIL